MPPDSDLLGIGFGLFFSLDLSNGLPAIATPESNRNPEWAVGGVVFYSVMVFSFRGRIDMLEFSVRRFGGLC